MTALRRTAVCSAPVQVLLSANMGSDFSKGICCVTCGRCKEEAVEEANEGTSETKLILQTLGETSMYIDTQPSSPALEASKQGSEEVQLLSQDRQPSAAAENTEICSAAGPIGTTEGWEAAWDSMDLLVTPADGENRGEVKVLTQVDNQQEKENMGDAKEKITPVFEAQPAERAAQGAMLCADEGQRGDQAAAGSEGSACAGIALQERNNLSFVEIMSESAAGQDCEIEPPAETQESLAGRNLPLCSLQVPEEAETSLSLSAEHVEVDRADLAEISPRPAKSAELTSLVVTAFLLSVQAAQKGSETADPSEVTANGMAEAYSAGAMPWGSLDPEGESLEPANLLFDLSEQETQSSVPAAQEMESGRCAEPAEPSEVLHQPRDESSCELEQEESRGGDAETAASEAEPQPRVTEQTAEPPEPPACVRVPVRQEAGFLDLAPSLSEVLWSSGEIEAENA